MNEVFIITGPTCAGKSDAAMKLASELGAEIISCDSVQVYRGMDIGSAKPSAKEMSRVRHHLIDVADPSEQFDVSKYIALAKTALAEIRARKKSVVVCGGSGFYLKAWFSAVTDDVAVSEEIRARAEETEREFGADGLARALERLDPSAAKFVDMQNPRRTRRALERCLASGKSVGELIEKFRALPCPLGEFERKTVLLDLPDAELSARIAARVGLMLARGLVDETRALIKAGIEKNPSASNAIGYRETLEMLARNSTDISELRGEIVANTIALVKKQRKYFRNILKI